MTNAKAAEADVLLCGYDIGFFDKSDIERWADRQIEAVDEPSAALIELAMLQSAHPLDVMRILRTFASPEPGLSIQNGAVNPCSSTIPRSVNRPNPSKSGRAQAANGRRTTGITRSFVLKSVTDSPTSMTCPRHSWPRTRYASPAGGNGLADAIISRSVPQIPTCRLLQRTSSANGVDGSGWKSICVADGLPG